MNQHYIINIFGAMATGKTTLAEQLHGAIDRSYLVDFDAIKKQISGYDSKRDRTVTTDLTYDVLDSIAQTTLPVIALLPPPPDEATYNKLVAIANKTGRTFIDIQLIAPLDTLEDRYPEWLRVHKALQQAGTHAPLRTLDEFMAAVQTPYYVPAGTHVFDSSQMSAEAIFEEVTTLLS